MKKERKGCMRVIFLCREVNRITGEIAVYQVADANPASIDPLVFVLGKKQRDHPEFQYFVYLAADRDRYTAVKYSIEELLKKAELPDRRTLLDHGIVHV